MVYVFHILVLLSSSWSGPGVDPAPAFVPQRPEFEAAARRLLAGNMQYIGRPRRAELIQARTAAGNNLQQWANITVELIVELLYDGDTTGAVAELEELHRRIPKPIHDPGFFQLQGLTYLRQAEVENCVRRHNAACCVFPLSGKGVHSVKSPAMKARRAYENALRLNPRDGHARYLLNICTMATGEYPKKPQAQYLIPPSAYASEYDIGRFRDIAPAVGVDIFDRCGGCIVDDFDNDGRLDIITSTLDPMGSMRFFRNNGKGGFDDRSVVSRINDQLGGLNIVSADYNNDGHLDILVLRGAWLFDDGRMRNSLLRNNGNGTFTDVTRAAGLAAPAAPTQAAAWLDFDNDGDLDLYVGNESRMDPQRFSPQDAAGGNYPAQLFENQGNGTFVDVAGSAGVTNNRYCKGVTAADYDNDGFIDLYVSNLGRNRLYRNSGDGSFNDVAAALGVQEPVGRSFATWFFDYNNDGWLDLFVASYQGDLPDIAADMLGQPHAGKSPRLYRNTHGRFTDVTSTAKLDRVFLPMGANFGDLDNDGFLDIYLATGSPAYEMIVPNIALRNNGGHAFQDVTTSGGFGHLQKGHGVAFADIDDDGDQDLYNQLGGFYRGDGFHNALFMNPGHGNHFVKMKLLGTQSNRSGYGARVTVVFRDHAEKRRGVHRAVGTVSSFGGSPGRLEIGLGQATAIDWIEIFWPASGTMQRLEHVPLDSHIEVVEDAEGFKRIDLPPIQLQLKPQKHQPS
jgi:hypothetical protein